MQVAYAIGVAHPMSVLVDTFGTEADGLSNERISELVPEHFDLRPGAIVRDLDLRRPIYRKTAAYGHFGRADSADYTWERTDKADALRAAAGLAAPARVLSPEDGRRHPLDERLHALGQPGEQLVRALLRELAVRHRLGEACLGGGDDRVDEAVDGLPLRRRDLGERLAALELRPELLRRHPEVLRGGAEAVHRDDSRDERLVLLGERPRTTRPRPLASASRSFSFAPCSGVSLPAATAASIRAFSSALNGCAELVGRDPEPRSDVVGERGRAGRGRGAGAEGEGRDRDEHGCKCDETSHVDTPSSEVLAKRTTARFAVRERSVSRM